MDLEVCRPVGGDVESLNAGDYYEERPEHVGGICKGNDDVATLVDVSHFTSHRISWEGHAVSSLRRRHFDIRK